MSSSELNLSVLRYSSMCSALCWVIVSAPPVLGVVPYALILLTGVPRGCRSLENRHMEFHMVLHQTGVHMEFHMGK